MLLKPLWVVFPYAHDMVAWVHTAKNSVCWRYLIPRYGGYNNDLNFTVLKTLCVVCLYAHDLVEIHINDT